MKDFQRDSSVGWVYALLVGAPRLYIDPVSITGRDPQSLGLVVVSEHFSMTQLKKIKEKVDFWYNVV